MSVTCIHCGREPGAWFSNTTQGAVCYVCDQHQRLHTNVLEHLELHRQGDTKPRLIPLEEPEELAASTTRPRQHTLGSVVFEETGETRPVKPPGEWILTGDDTPAFLSNPAAYTTYSFSILRPVRVKS